MSSVELVQASVAALYVDPLGPYARRHDVDAWDEARDARLYAGPLPVVAHPPCARWSRIATCTPLVAHLRGQDGGTFEAALRAVRTYGGVLEHPAYSLAWTRYGLPEPTVGGWTLSLGDPGYTTEVDQAAYGHLLRKPTWLYYVGATPPPRLLWHDRGDPRQNVRNASKQQRERTPDAFLELLLSLARLAASRPA